MIPQGECWIFLPFSDLRSLATTPSTASRSYADWDPDTPTLKAWAKRELAISRSQLEGRILNSSDDDDDDDNLDTVDTVGGRASKSICTTSLSSKDDDERSRSPYGEVDEEDGEDGPRLHLTRLSYRSSDDGRIYPTFDGMSDSSESEDQAGEEYGDEEDNINDQLVERYYHVDDDDNDYGDDEDEEDNVDDIYDDTS